MADGHNYPNTAREMAGPGNETAVEAIARHLHYNESLHAHGNVEGPEPCSYCWLRAGKAIEALYRAGIELAAPVTSSVSMRPGEGWDKVVDRAGRQHASVYPDPAEVARAAAWAGEFSG